MTLDPAYRSSADMVREAAEADAKREYDDWQFQRMMESSETAEAQWAHRFRQSAAERPEVWYEDSPGIDRRMFAVDGDVA